MAGIIYFLQTDLEATNALVEAFQEEFENWLKDLFTDKELEYFEPKIDSIAAVYVQPLLSELSFDDFYFDESKESEQRPFFESCKSSISFENLPFLETNPFQVSYLKELALKFENLLVDRGGVSELLDKEGFLQELSHLKDIDSLVGRKNPPQAPQPQKKTLPVDPIDFLILDVYKELDRLGEKELNSEDLSPKLRKIFNVMKSEKNGDATDLLRKTGLNAKDFDDGLESLKFWLRKF